MSDVVRPTISVVMVTYNRRDSLSLTLPPLVRDPSADEIVVVVNGSRDGSLEYVQQLAAGDPRITCLFVENAGLINGQRVGAEAATSEVLLFLDDDVIAAPGLAGDHALRHADDDQLVLLGYMPTRRPVKRRPGDVTTMLYADEYERHTRGYEADPDRVLTHLWMGHMSIRRRDLLRVDPFRAGTALRYHQDQHIGILCRRAGMHGAFDRSLLSQHMHVRTLDSFLEQARKQGADRRIIHAMHPDVLGPFDQRSVEVNLNAPLRLLLRSTRHPLMHRVTVALLVAIARGAGGIRFWALETRTFQMLRRIEHQWGARHDPMTPAMEMSS